MTVCFRLLCCLTVLLLSAISVQARSFRTVVIDAGHGAHDFGCRNGYAYEKHFALDIARRLERYLRKRGVHTVMTRSTDRFIPLGTRAEIGNSYPNSIFVSIHINSATRVGASGVETFYFNSAGYRLANLVQQRIIANTNHGGNRGVKFARFKVLRESVRPAILVECAFITNPQDNRRLRDRAYREAVAQSIGQGILRF